jgi:ribosomal protein S18 acetylase RimI-like enzyme
MFRAEKMGIEDFSFAVQLANTMDWDIAESDLQLMKKLEPDGCFVLWRAQERVGIATCISYGKIGWFGNLVVKEEYRNEGAGTFLVKNAVKSLRNRGVETVGLYAYQHLVGFYERVGFKPQDEFVVLNGKTVAYRQFDMLKVANEKDIPMLVEFDQRCFGWNRDRLLKSILREKGNLCFFSVQNGEISGFVGAKVYDDMAEIGPLVCRQDSRDVAVESLKSILSRLRNLDIYVCVPVKENALLETLQTAGLKEKFRLTRMFLGPVAAQSCIYMPESLERG